MPNPQRASTELPRNTFRGSVTALGNHRASSETVLTPSLLAALENWLSLLEKG
jgi:hypothetical protein